MNGGRGEQCSRYGHPLPLATGQLVRVPARERRFQADLRQAFPNPGGEVDLVRAAEHGQGFGDALADTHPRVE